MSETPRQILAKVDSERAVASWADDMMLTLRLGRPVKVGQLMQRGPFGKERKYLYELEDRMPPAATDALSRALRTVRDEAKAKADALEASVTTRPTEATP